MMKSHWENERQDLYDQLQVLKAKNSAMAESNREKDALNQDLKF